MTFTFYGYNAESYNPNTGLEFLRASYYNANQGRFFQEDTYLGDITDPLTLNRYAYVKNSPLNYIDPSGNVPSTTPDSLVSPNWTGYPSNGSNESACKEIAALIERNHGALIGGATGVAIVMLTAASGGSALLIFGGGMVGGATGMMTGGMLHKGVDSASIAYELKTQYGYDIAECQDIEVSELPEAAKKLCEQYQENVEDAETYLDAGTTVGIIGTTLYEAGVLIDAIGASVKSTSKNAYEKIKNWVNEIIKRESKATTAVNWEGKTDELAKFSPIEIPDNAAVKIQHKTGGYDQISYKWSDGTYKYEARWHTPTPNAPMGSPNSWVIERTIPGTPTGQMKVQNMYTPGVNNDWTPKWEWEAAVDAYNKGITTPHQDAILNSGHIDAP